MGILKRFSKFSFAIGVSLLLVSCSGMQSKEETYIGKEVFDLPSNYTLKEIVVKSQKVVGENADEVKKVVGLMPEKLPSSPGEPTIKVIPTTAGNTGGEENSEYTSPVVINCSDAAAIVTAVQYPSDFDFVETTGVLYKVCIYPYSKGYRVYVVGAYTRYIPNKIGQMLTGVVKKFKGTECENMTDLNCSWYKLVQRTKKEFKDAKILELKYPNGNPGSSSETP